MVTKETITEYIADENGVLHISKQKVNEKSVPPNADIIKLIYQHYTDKEVGYDEMTDEELEREKSRLLKLLKEEDCVSRKGKSKS